MSDTHTRRRVLELAGSATALGLAGCLGSAAGGADELPGLAADAMAEYDARCRETLDG